MTLIIGMHFIEKSLSLDNFIFCSLSKYKYFKSKHIRYCDIDDKNNMQTKPKMCSLFEQLLQRNILMLENNIAYLQSAFSHIANEEILNFLNINYH